MRLKLRIPKSASAAASLRGFARRLLGIEQEIRRGEKHSAQSRQDRNSAARIVKTISKTEQQPAKSLNKTREEQSPQKNLEH